jgi:hypothetical protein
MYNVRAGRALVAALMAAAMAGCGGEGEDGGGGPTQDADAAGLYEGSMVLDGTARTFRVAVAPDGRFAGGISAMTGGSNSRVMSGTGVADGDTFTATGWAYAPGIAPFAAGGTTASLTIGNGLIDEGVRLQGDYAAGGESGSFTVQYRAEMTGRGSLLSRIAGTYDTYPAPPVPAQGYVVTIGTTGQLQLAGNGCTGMGQVSIQDPDVNVYSVDFTLSGCLAGVGFSGIASLEDGPTGTNNRVILFALSGQMPFGFTGLKQ